METSVAGKNETKTVTNNSLKTAYNTGADKPKFSQKFIILMSILVSIFVYLIILNIFDAVKLG